MRFLSLCFARFCGYLAPPAHFEQLSLGFCWQLQKTRAMAGRGSSKTRYKNSLVYGTLATLEYSRENNIFLFYPLSPTLIHHLLTQHVHHGHHAALANN